MNKVAGQARRRLWLRRMAFIALCLFLGVVTTIAVSWQIARRWPGGTIMTSPSYQWSTTTGPKWMYATKRWPGAEERVGILANEHVSRRTQALPTHSPPAWSRFADTTGPPNELFEQATGWPMVAKTSKQKPNWRSGLAQAIEGIDLGPAGVSRNGSGFRRLLPTRPILPGFVVNVGSYSVAWWVVLLVSAWLTRFIWRWPAKRREHRGRCPLCGYDLRADFAGGCSECGWKRRTSESRAG
jgi:hypothetical protein